MGPPSGPGGTGDDRPGIDTVRQRQSLAGPRLTAYVLRGADLTPVERRTSATTTTAALEQLVKGPTRREANTGIRTTLAMRHRAGDPDDVADIQLRRRAGADDGYRLARVGADPEGAATSVLVAT